MGAASLTGSAFLAHTVGTNSLAFASSLSTLLCK